MSMELGNPFAVVDVLLRHRVALVIIGGYAVAFHGYVRATEDIDLVFLRTDANESALLSALTEIDAHWIGDDIDPGTGMERLYRVSASYIATTHLMMLCTKVGYVDIFDYIPQFPHHDVHELLGTAVYSEGRPFVSLEWLKRMKRASLRSKDLEDLEKLP